MANAPIADRLYIAGIAVKRHLTSVYRKLDIDRRTELMARLMRPDWGAGGAEEPTEDKRGTEVTGDHGRRNGD